MQVIHYPFRLSLETLKNLAIRKEESGTIFLLASMRARYSMPTIHSNDYIETSYSGWQQVILKTVQSGWGNINKRRKRRRYKTLLSTRIKENTSVVIIKEKRNPCTPFGFSADFQPPHKLSQRATLILDGSFRLLDTCPCSVLSHHTRSMSHFAGSYYLHPEPRIYNPSLGDPFFDISGTFEDTVHDDVSCIDCHFGKFQHKSFYKLGRPAICPDRFLSPIIVAWDNCCLGCGSGCCCALPELIASTEPHECNFQSSMLSWASIFFPGTLSELVHGSDCCKPRYHLLSESESRALAPSFRFRLLGSIQSSS
ncbi:hypothetical protein Tco_0320515 [Tanacetum coccineum]